MKIRSSLYRRLFSLLLLSFSAMAMTNAKALESQSLTSDLDALILEGNNLIAVVEVSV